MTIDINMNDGDSDAMDNSAAVRPLCAVGLSGSCQAVTLGPDSDGAPRLSDSAVRLSDTCCQTVGESAVSAVRLSGTVRRCPGFAVRLSDQGSASLRAHPASGEGVSPVEPSRRRSDGDPSSPVCLWAGEPFGRTEGWMEVGGLEGRRRAR